MCIDLEQIKKEIYFRNFFLMLREFQNRFFEGEGRGKTQSFTKNKQKKYIFIKYLTLLFKKYRFENNIYT